MRLAPGIIILIGVCLFQNSVAAEDDGPGFDVDIDMGAETESFSPKAVNRDFIRGWLDYRSSERYKTHPANNNKVLNELRGQIEAVNYFSELETHLRVDGLIDEAVDDEDIEVREAYVKSGPADWLDVSVGRQIMLWNTADLIFVNDLFPKDYVSFYAGRDAEQEYLMLPVDSVNFSFYTSLGQFDFVYQKGFTPYSTPTGERLSFYNPLAGEIVGENQVFSAYNNDEDVVYARYLTDIGPVEFGVYGYDGYWYSPFGFDVAKNRAYYPRLRSLGFSGRASLGGGIITGEVAYYDSPEDDDGSNPFIPNDSLRAYIGYEHEIIRDLTMSGQYYTEQIQQYDNYVQAGGLEDKTYKLWTLRVTRNLMKQTLTLSLFIFYSPTDEDSYTRLNVFYSPSDKWMFNVGVNEFDGKRTGTRFGQLEQNSAVFAAVRRKF